MPDGMTKVQQCALSLLRRVVLYNFALDLTASGDHLFHMFGPVPKWHHDVPSANGILIRPCLPS